MFLSSRAISFHPDKFSKSAVLLYHFLFVTPLTKFLWVNPKHDKTLLGMNKFIPDPHVQVVNISFC